MKASSICRLLARCTAVATLLGMTAAGNATHTWGGYHWARTTNSFTLKLGDNLNNTWKPYLSTTSSDWTLSPVLDTVIVPGGTRPKNCRPSAGRGEVCNANYGNNGWLGIASISITGGVHITQGTVKLNDTYFNSATYNTQAWRNLVMCQEVGHIFGLAHQDEAFDNPNLGTCMDYTNNPGTNQYPNAHDYQQLEFIYNHLDSTTTVDAASTNHPSAMSNRDFDRPSSWGRLVKRSKDGAREIYERDFGGGHKVVTHVFWALEEGGPAHRQQRANEE
jgi:hypothetical protein